MDKERGGKFWAKVRRGIYRGACGLTIAVCATGCWSSCVGGDDGGTTDKGAKETQQTEKFRDLLATAEAIPTEPGSNSDLQKKDCERRGGEYVEKIYKFDDANVPVIECTKP